MRRVTATLKFGLLSIGLTLATATAASAASAPPPAGIAAPPLILAHGCHADVRSGFVPEFGGRARHYHRGPNCRPVVAEERRRDGPPPGFRRDGRRDGRDFRGGPPRRDGPPPPRRRNCVRVGPVEVCE